jgi:hypothetical protein
MYTVPFALSGRSRWLGHLLLVMVTWNSSILMVANSHGMKSSPPRYLPANSVPFPQNSTERSSSLEVGRRVAGRTVSHLLWNPEAHYRVHCSSSLDPLWNQLNSEYIHPISLKSTLILSSSLEYVVQVVSPLQILVLQFCMHYLFFQYITTCLSHHAKLDNPHNI